MRLVIFLVMSGMIVGATYFIYHALTQVEFAYVRFRDGILTLDRRGAFGSKGEVQFAPDKSYGELTAGQLVNLSDKLSWYVYPSGELVEAGSPEQEAICRTLRFAHNTQLLEAELDT